MDLIVAATAEELGAMQRHLAGRMAETHVVGIGMVDAAAGLATRLANARVKIARVLFIGSAGASLDSGLKIGDLAAVERAELIDGLAGEEQSAYLPAPLVKSITAGVVLAGLPLAVCRSRVGITRVEGRGEPCVESMEAFAVLRAAMLHDVPAGAVLAISNFIGADAHQQWSANWQSAMTRLHEALPHLL